MLARSFDAGPGAYARFRPGYPPAAVRAALPGDARDVLDLGAGTGKLTESLLGRGLQVTAVEPLPGMLAELSRRFPQATAVPGSAEDIPLPDRAVDCVVVGQAFHWFDPDRALAEIARVLRPGGRLLALVPRAERPGTARPPLVQAWVDALRPEARDTTWQQVRFDGRAWCDSAALPGLLQPAFGPPRLTALDAQTRLSPDEAWAWFTGMYDLHLLPAPAWPAVQSRFAALLPPLQGTDGRVPLQHAYLLIDASRAS